MGIRSLAKVIQENARSAVFDRNIRRYAGQKIALDASMIQYQFMASARQGGNMLCGKDGDTTSHLMGLFYRTIRLTENAVKPLYVFDGRPPGMKGEELAKRAERRKFAENALALAQQSGDQAGADKWKMNLIKVSHKQNEESRELLRLMGIPSVDAPGEAEAQCAVLVKEGRVFAAGTEDMDTLTFGSDLLVRNLNFQSKSVRSEDIKEYNLKIALEDMELNREEFVDLCIMLGCDYCGTIRGVGPKTALELIKQYRTIENVLDNIDTQKLVPPENWEYEQARKLFFEPAVVEDQSKLNFAWEPPQPDELLHFMCEEKGFNRDRITKGIGRLLAPPKVKFDSQGQPLEDVKRRKSTSTGVHVKTASTTKTKVHTATKSSSKKSSTKDIGTPDDNSDCD